MSNPIATDRYKGLTGMTVEQAEHNGEDWTYGVTLATLYLTRAEMLRLADLLDRERLTVGDSTDLRSAAALCAELEADLATQA